MNTMNRYEELAWLEMIKERYQWLNTTPEAYIRELRRRAIRIKNELKGAA